jgi:hypothetical protein
MALSIEISRPADPKKWDAAWSVAPYATYFQSREWAELWQSYSGGRTRAAGVDIQFSDGKSAVVALSYERGRAAPLGRYLCSAAGTFGGWLSTEPLSTAHRGLLAEHMLGLGDIVWRVNPYDAPDVASLSAAIRSDETQAVHLLDGFDSVVRRWTKGHRSAASKARREGVAVSLGRTSADWLAFSQVYADSVARWGERATSVYSPRLFETFAQLNSPFVRLWLAHHENTPVAGALCLYARRHVAYWLGGALASHFPLRPVHLLMHEAIAHACRNGYEWFDLNPSGGHDGVAAFKRGFGTIRLPAPVVIGQTPTSRALTAVRDALRPLRSLGR